MSEAIQKIGFGVINDTDESLKGKVGGGKFGLNTGFITKLEYNPNAGKDGAAADAIDIVFLVGEKEFPNRIYDVTKVYDKDGNEITDSNDVEFIKGYNALVTQNMAVVLHALKAVGVTQEMYEAAVKTPPTTFADWARIVTGLAPANFDKKPVDGFLEYQWSIKGDNDRTYLQLPKNMKGGRFLCASIPGTWKEENSWVETKDGVESPYEGLRYVNESGEVHLFERNSSYMESPKANQQIEGQAAAATAVVGTNPQNAAKSTWGK